MKKILLSTINIFWLTTVILANEGDFAVSKIEASLLKNAHAVVRLDEMKLEINGIKGYRYTNHYAITILDEKGEDWAQLYEYYDKFTDIISIEGFLYDADGKTLKKIKKKDTQDISGVDGGNLMDDSRFKKHNFYHRIYPYTIEYIIETNKSYTFSFPAWQPQAAEQLSVEQSNFTVLFPQDYSLRYKVFNYSQPPVESMVKENKSLTWSIKNLPALIDEPYSPRWSEITPTVLFAPSEFQMDDFKGNMTSWKDFGKFIYDLKQGKDELPPSIIQKVHAIADPIQDKSEKVAKLYQFMQENTRYISIQLGIGGLKPFPAKDVATKRYGDCKALSNYMYSILKEAGINSYYTIIKAGRGATYFNTDFPSNQFNHVILCTPLQNDTMWLECTSQTLQAGYLSDFTCDRPALLVDENGGTLVRTPIYTMKDNLQVRNIKGKLDEKGNLQIDTKSEYHGLQQDGYHQIIKGLSKDKLKEYLNEVLKLSMYEIDDFSYTEIKTKIPAIQENLKILANSYATVTGRRMFIMPNVMTKSSKKLTADSSRKYEIQLNTEFQDIDSVEVEVPTGYTVEALPAKVSMETKFGKYQSSIKVIDNKLYYYRNHEQKSGRFPKEDYTELVKYFETIYKADRVKIVFVK